MMQATRIDYSRYLYIPVLSGFAARAATTEEGAGASSAVYKRYKLSEEKTFASFFHPDKLQSTCLGTFQQAAECVPVH